MTRAITLLFLLLASGPYWRLVPVARGQAVWYDHERTSADAKIDPWTRAFVALQGDWDREPYSVLVRHGDRWANASRRDVTRSRYAAELSPKLCDKLGLDYGYNGDGVAFGMWDAAVYAVVRL